MIKPPTLGIFLSHILEARQQTARAFAEGAGIAQSGVSNIILGKNREPDPRTLKAIADYLGIEVFILFRLVGYVPPADELYGTYDPMALYIARRFALLSEEKQQALLHVMETLIDDAEIKSNVQTLRESAEPSHAFIQITDAQPEIINQAANWYLTQARFTTPAQIDPQLSEEVLPGLPFGQLSRAARQRLLALMRHKIRQIFAFHMVDEENYG